MTVSPIKKPKAQSSLPEAEILDLLPLQVARISASDKVVAINKAAQEFWSSRPQILPSTLRVLVERVRESGEAMTAHDVSILRHLHEYKAAVHLVPHGDEILVTIDLKSTLHTPAASAWKQEITQAAGVMAAMMAHEVKNPLSSIRGAAQLLLESVSQEEKGLADLICKETLRIRDLLDQVEIFSDERSPELTPLNIHEPLQYSMRVAQAGLAGHVTFIEKYDPSLPMALSQRELLVQLFLNIIKNAAEALTEVKEPTITLSTCYQSGFSLTDKKLPLVVTISDNGQGIPSDIRRKLFEPLVSSKASGRGLGLAVVAKIAADIGAMVQCDDPAGRKGASFSIHLPVSKG